MKRLGAIGVYLLMLAAGVTPLALLTSRFGPSADVFVVGGVNLLGWSFALALMLARRDLRRAVSKVSSDFGIESRFRSFEQVTVSLLRDAARKTNAFLPNLLEKKIDSKEELSKTLERIVAHAFKLLAAESAELALFDRQSGNYHSSFVLGKPFRKSAQAMLSGALEGDERTPENPPDVLIEPLAFGGTVLGSLRLGLRRGTIPAQSDKEIMHLLALQAGLAVINAQYTEELRRMRLSSEESNRAKTGFLANLSHEIRAPLGIMLNAVELVLDGLCGPISKDQLDTLSMVRGNGEHLLELINDVLDYARVESGKIVPQPADVLVNDLLKDLIQVVRKQADNKQHKLILHPSEEALTIRADRRHLRQMLINLLTNAIKYTPDKGQIEIWAERIPGGKIRMSVKDTGVGIEEADRSKVFSPFERIQHAYSINQVGTGLGMPLTKRLAEVNGASIDFSSVAGAGSHFWLIFSSVEYNAAAAEPAAAEPQAKGKGELVLLGETDQGERDMIVRYLTHIGFRVAATGEALEFMEAVRAQRVDVAIVDNRMVDNPEYNLLEDLRNSASSAQLPLVLTSSKAFVFDIEKYLRAGADRCITKPVSLRELGLTIRTLIDAVKQEQRKSGARVSAPVR